MALCVRSVDRNLSPGGGEGQRNKCFIVASCRMVGRRAREATPCIQMPISRMARAVLRKGCACYWGACDTRQVTAPESCQSFGVLGQVAAPKAVLGVVGGVPLFINHGNRERCAELWGGSSHPPRSAMGGREAECGLSPGSLCAPVAARRLGGRDCDQGLGLPECGFLLSGLDGLVLAKV